MKCKDSDEFISFFQSSNHIIVTTPLNTVKVFVPSGSWIQICSFQQYSSAFRVKLFLSSIIHFFSYHYFPSDTILLGQASKLPPLFFLPPLFNSVTYLSIFNGLSSTWATWIKLLQINLCFLFLRLSYSRDSRAIFILSFELKTQYSYVLFWHFISHTIHKQHKITRRGDRQQKQNSDSDFHDKLEIPPCCGSESKTLYQYVGKSSKQSIK